MLPGNYNTTVVQPVSAQSANQIGQKEEEEEEERDERGKESKTSSVRKKKQGGSREDPHTSCIQDERLTRGGGASQFQSQRRRRDGRGCAYRAER